MEIVLYFIGMFITYLVIAGAVKKGTSDALYDFKVDLLKEIQELLDRNKHKNPDIDSPDNEK